MERAKMTVQTFQVGIKALIRNPQGQVLMVHIPEWSGNAGHWDLPGGRIEQGEQFLDTLKRELLEEIGVAYEGTPRHLATVLTTITIPVGTMRLPLIFVIYETKLPDGSDIKLDPESAEDTYGWFDPAEAADKMGFKFTPEFCAMVRELS